MTHAIVNANSIVQNVIQIKNGIVGYTNVKYLKFFADISVIACDKIISVMDIVSTKMTNTIPTNATSTASINCNNKEVR